MSDKLFDDDNMQLIQNIENIVTTGDSIILDEKVRYRAYDPMQSRFIFLSPNDLFPSGSYERFIVDIFHEIDLIDFKKTYGLDIGGNTDYNPTMILTVLFYSISTGLYNYRKIDKMCQYDQRYTCKY